MLRPLGLLLFVAALSPSSRGQEVQTVPPAAVLTTPHRLELVVKDVAVPWGIVPLADGRLIFTERPGRVRLIDTDGRLRPEPLLTLDVALGNKMGLLDVVADPDFARNGFLYLAYNYADTTADTGQALRVVRYRLVSEEALGEPHVVIEGLPAHRNHTGCRLRFGPDGKLYLTSGDANLAPAAQDLGSLRGKILRLEPDGAIPADNPFVGRADARPEIWSYGHRNPQGLDFEPGSGRLLAAEHGPNGGDELNWVQRAANYGWPVVSHRRNAEGMVAPLLEFTPSIAPADLLFYRGQAFPELTGHALVACLRGEGILDVALEGGAVTGFSRLFHRQFGRLRALAISPEGYLYFSTSQLDPPEGRPRPGYDLIVRVVPTATPPGPYPALSLVPPPPDPTTVTPAELAVTRDGAVLARAHCASCHGPAMENLVALRRPEGFWRTASDDAGLRKLILEGNLTTGMPGYSAQLDGAQVDALLSHLAAMAAPDPRPPTNAAP